MSTATESKPVFECHGWTVVEDLAPEDPDDYTWLVKDRDGDVYDCRETRAEAVELCSEHGLAEYRERLWAAITEESDPDDFPLHTLQAIADMLGHNAKTI
jgi:hypothetical protein